MFQNINMQSGTEKMYFLNKFCCICMNKSDLKHMFDADNDGVSHYNKLTSSITEMHFKEMNNQRLICGECCVTLNTVYNFRQTCLRSKTNLITYISQLQTFSKVSGTLSVRLTDIHQTKVVKEEIKIKCENEGSLTENNQQEFQTASYKDIIQLSATVKKECESYEDASSAHEDATVLNESDVKVEDVEHQTMMEDEPYTDYTEIDIKEEDPLAIVKEEPMSDSETPLDGSTNQADADTSEEPKEREETTVGNERTQNIQKVVGGLYKCKICKKSFNHKGNFNSHKRIHSGERPFNCEICKKSFKDKSNFNCHMRTHSGVRPFSCEICKKSFSNNSNFYSHMRIHSGEKPFKCDICNKSFNLKGNFNNHMRIHSGEKPYVCEICRKGFTWKRCLDDHMKIHSGERPFECEICRKSFTLKVYLYNHMKTHSGERPHECEICHRNYIHRKHLTVHMRTHDESHI